MTNVTTAGAEAGLEESHIDSSAVSLSPEVPATEAAPRFDDLGLSPEILRAVTESGYTTPTPIQAQGIPKVLERRDIIGIAQTGTGKTASFTLPMIELLARGRAKARMPRSLILEPTRELAAQVAESFERYGKYNRLSMALLIGGVSFDEQDKKLDRGVDVLIATPGRLLDHFERGKLMLSQVQVLVIDEADRMLDMGFIPDVERICKLIPFTRQTLFYSATMPPEIQRLTEQFLHNPVRVEVSRPATTATNITQEIICVPNNDWAKREALRRLVRENPVKNAIVFCNRKRDVDVVAKSLGKHGFSVAPLHGDLDQSLRTKTLEAFKNGEIQLLVASDVAARGLDIPAVSHVFNFDVPFHADDYVHRIGRTGRAGRSGHAYMLATPRDTKLVEAIEKLTGGAVIAARTMEDLEVREDLNKSSGGRDRGKSDGRNRRGGKSRDHRPDHRQQQARTEPAPREEAPKPIVQAEAPAPRPPEPQRLEPARQETPRQEASRQEASRKQHHDDRGHSHKRHENQKSRQQQQARPEPVDHSQLPAFLMRPVILPKAVEKPAPRPPRAKKADAEA
jgi:superfamily II DNA/RNA helicase